MIEQPQPSPNVSWMKTRIAWKKSISGWMMSWMSAKSTGYECDGRKRF